MFFEFLEIFNLNYIDLYDSYSYNDKSEKVFLFRNSDILDIRME